MSDVRRATHRATVLNRTLLPVLLLTILPTLFLMVSCGDDPAAPDDPVIDEVTCIEYEDYLYHVGSSDTPGLASSLDANGALVFVADQGEGLQAIDFSTPNDPTTRGLFPLAGDLFNVAVAGSYAFLPVGGDGLKVIDFDDPDAPSLAGEVNGDHWIHVAVEGGYAYAVRSQDSGAPGLVVFDIHSIPGTPQMMGEIASSAPHPQAVAVSGDYAYLVGLALEVIDITDPTTPTIRGEYLLFPMGNDIAVQGDQAYVLGNDFLMVFDVSDPTAPSETARIGTSASPRGLQVAGDYAYVAVGLSGLAIFDIGDPSAPELAGGLSPGGEGHDVVLSGDSLYLAGGNAGVHAFHAGGPELLPTTSYLTADRARAVTSDGQYAYVACVNQVIQPGVSRLQVLSASSSSVSEVSVSAQLGGAAGDVALFQDWVVMALYGAGLQLIDVREPGAPVLAGSVVLPTVRSVAVSGKYAFAAHGGGMQVVDIGTPAAPVLQGNVPTAGQVVDIAIEGDHAFLVGGLPGFEVIDISNPLAPFKVTDFGPMPGNSAVAVAGDYAYVVDEDFGLTIIDVSSPAAPISSGVLDLEWRGISIAIDGSYAYVGAWEGLQVVDVSTPSASEVLFSIKTSEPVFDVARAGKLILLAEMDTGLRVFMRNCQP